MQFSIIIILKFSDVTDFQNQLKRWEQGQIIFLQMQTEES